MWKDDYLLDLKKLRLLLQNKDIKQFKIDFTTYLNDIVNIGPYDKTVWKPDWRDTVYSFGQDLKSDATDALNIIKSLPANKRKNEVIEFIYSEILWNFFDNKDGYVKKEICRLINIYPTNPEFHHTYSHILQGKGDFYEALKEAKHAALQEKDNDTFCITYTGKMKSYFEDLVSQNKLELAETFLNDEKKDYRVLARAQQNLHLRINCLNAISSLEDRLRDHKLIAKQIVFFKDRIDKVVNTEQRKLIEVLGLFAGILGFILTNISIGLSQLKVKDMITLMFGMAIVLMIFVITISYLFSHKENHKPFLSFLKQRKFYSILILFIILVILYQKY